MEGYKLFCLMLFSANSVNSQYQYQYQQYPYYNQPQLDPYYGQQEFYYPQQLYYPANSRQVYYPYPYQFGGVYQQQQPNQKETPAVTPDPYANVETEYIDVRPEIFRKIIQTLKVQPTVVAYEDRVVKNSPKYSYVVSTNQQQYNQTNAPSAVHKYETNSKVYTFNKTFVLHPGDDTNSVVNLNFVNGVQVTEPTTTTEQQDHKTTNGSTASLLDKNGKRFIDVPQGCEEGLRYSATGGCFSPFSLHLDDDVTENNTMNQDSDG